MKLILLDHVFFTNDNVDSGSFSDFIYGLVGLSIPENCSHTAKTLQECGPISNSSCSRFVRVGCWKGKYAQNSVYSIFVQI